MHYTACKNFLSFARADAQVRTFCNILDNIKNTSSSFLFYSNLVAAVGLGPTVVYVSRAEDFKSSGYTNSPTPP